MGYSSTTLEGSPPSQDSVDVEDVEIGAREHHLAASARTMAELERILAPDQGPFTDWHERGAICVLTQSTGANRTTLVVHEVITPDADDLTAPRDGDRPDLEFTPTYRQRARQAAENVYGQAGLLYVHSHPKRASGHFSPGDLEHDTAQLYQDAKHLGDDVPLAAAVAHEGDDPWRVWQYNFQVARTPAQRDREEFGPSSVDRTPITAIRVVGVRMEKRHTGDGIDCRGPAAARGRLNAAQQDSTITLWGNPGQRRLAGLRIGIIGCGGGGSILAEVLARLGVGELVLVDFDRVKPANANRHLGATDEDIEQRRPKVHVSAEVARDAATCPDFEVTPVVGSIFEEEPEWADYHALDEILDCDLVMNAADPHTVRCTVGRLAYAHFIPVVDAGSNLDAEGGRLTDESRSTTAVAGPGNPCLKCAGQWSGPGYEEDLTGTGHEEGYADNDEPDDADDDGEADQTREPSAMPTNLLTMGLACQRLLHLVHGLSPETAVGAANFRHHAWAVDWEDYGTDQLRSCRDSCHRPAEGLGDNADLKRGPDLKLREERDTTMETELGTAGPADQESLLGRLVRFLHR